MILNIHRLVAGAEAARVILNEMRAERLDSFCLKLPDGTPDRGSLDPEEEEDVTAIEAALADLNEALGDSRPLDPKKQEA